MASTGNPIPSEGVSLLPLPLEVEGTVAKRPEDTKQQVNRHQLDFTPDEGPDRVKVRLFLPVAFGEPKFTEDSEPPSCLRKASISC